MITIAASPTTADPMAIPALAPALRKVEFGDPVAERLVPLAVEEGTDADAELGDDDKDEDPHLPNEDWHPVPQ